MKVLTVVGARPQFIKASPVSFALQQVGSVEEIILHTGQHFDKNMSDIFFQQLNVPKPDIQLDINGGSHGQMTGRMLVEIESSLTSVQPDCVLVYGDTNSTLAGALSAAKLNIPVAHVEAGLRSFNMRMPEEINRILTDQISDFMFCPTQAAMLNLENEGLHQRGAQCELVGDVMLDASMAFAAYAVKPDAVNEEQFILATVHRAENTDDPERLQAIVDGINRIHKTVAPVVIPLHPRTQKAISDANLTLDAHIIEPVGYLEMIWLLKNCQMVMTDSGGVQKEAFFFAKPCVTLRDETEWSELVEMGVNRLVFVGDSDITMIVREALNTDVPAFSSLYGGGLASERIAKRLAQETF